MASNRYYSGVRVCSGVRNSLNTINWSALFDADSGITLSGSNVTQWDSTVSPATYSATRGDANGPTYSATGFMSARGGVTFNGSANYMLCNALGGFTQGADTPFSVAIHFSASSFASSSRTLWSTHDNANTSVNRQVSRITFVVTTGQVYFEKGDASTLDSDSPFSSSSTSTEYVLVISHSGTALNAWRNNAAASGNPYTNNVGVLNTQSYSSIGSQISYTGSPSLYFAGTIRRIGFFNSAIDSTTAGQIYNAWYGS